MQDAQNAKRLQFLTMRLQRYNALTAILKRTTKLTWRLWRKKHSICQQIIFQIDQDS